MKISLNILTVIFMVVSSYSQSIELPQEIRTKIIEKNSIPEGVKGSPFFNDEFLIGTVYANNIKPFKAYLRYDAFNDEIQMKENKKIIAFEDCLEDCPTSGEGTVCLEKCQTKYQIDWGEYIFWKDLKSKLHQ